MNTKTIAFLTALLIASCVSTVRVLAQQRSASPERLRLKTYDGDMASLLAHLADAYDVTIGPERCDPAPRIGRSNQGEWSQLLDL